MDIDKKLLPHPLLKWVGGKQKHIQHIINKFPNKMNNYHEPFIGGGSVLLALLWCQQNSKIIIKGSIHAYDFNLPLISMYNNIKSSPKEVYKELSKIITEYHELSEEKGNKKPKTKKEGLTCKESYYYWIRKQYNEIKDKTTLIASAYFIFMNKTGFRGMYREGPNGMNIPCGHYYTINLSEYDILKFSELIQGVTFIHSDFSESLKKVSPDDFVYLDPPYAPEDEKSFVGYNKEGFDLNQHKKLFTMCNELPIGSKFMMSNANVSLIREHLSDDIYKYHVISCRRAINSKNPGAKTEEVVIINYQGDS